MEKLKVKLVRLNEEGVHDLYVKYDGQTSPQGVNLCLDLDDGRVYCEPDFILGSGMPMTVFHGRLLRWGIPVLKTAAANKLMEEVEPLLQRILDGSEVVFDGSNLVGDLNEEAQEYSLELESFLDQRWRLVEPEDLVNVWDAYEWFDPCPVRVDARATDEELEEIAQNLTEEAQDLGVDLLEHLYEYLDSRRDDAREVLGDDAADRL